MTKHSIDDSSKRLRKLWLAYEYPGRIVLRDVARVTRMFKRVYAALAGRNQASQAKEESEHHLWAERRE